VVDPNDEDRSLVVEMLVAEFAAKSATSGEREER
jgi:hypothetical protein